MNNNNNSSNNLNSNSLTSKPFASLNNPTQTFDNITTNKDKIKNDFKGQRGVYTLTNNESKSQYVGSSNDLGNRLSCYLRPKYTAEQAKRGSVICRSINKYGLDAFTLSVEVLGPSLEGAISADNLPDYLLVEQSFLDKFDFVYNVNRTATAIYSPSQEPRNLGSYNPSFSKLSNDSFAWNHKHSEAARTSWSIDRGKFQFYLYSITSFELVTIFPSATKLSAFFPNVSKRFGTDIAKLISNSKLPAVIFTNYIISFVPLTTDFLRTNLSSFTIKNVSQTKITNNVTIYGFNPTTNSYLSWTSKEACTFFLTGKKFENKSTLNRRLGKNIEYCGFFLQTKPFESNK
jgi:group I intron endonuclease